MVFGTDPHLERARRFLDSGDRDDLRSACLELRFALERVAYQKLQLRLDKISFREIGAWQPRRVMDRLMDLVDNRLTRDSELRIASDDSDAKDTEREFLTLGVNKGVNPKNLGKYWHKLGSYLHVSVPKKKGERPQEPDELELREFLDSVFQYVENITNTQFDVHFSQNVTFSCKKCGQSIVRNSEILNEGDVVQCQNDNCNASYIAHETDGNFTFERYQLYFECKNCDERTYIEANALLKLERNTKTRVPCASCGAKYDAEWTIQLKPVAEDG